MADQRQNDIDDDPQRILARADGAHKVNGSVPDDPVVPTVENDAAQDSEAHPS